MSYMKKYALRTEFEGMHDITAQVPVLLDNPVFLITS